VDLNLIVPVDVDAIIAKFTEVLSMDTKKKEILSRRASCRSVNCQVERDFPQRNSKDVQSM
jgi:hypothetical protein